MRIEKLDILHFHGVLHVRRVAGSFHGEGVDNHDATWSRDRASKPDFDNHNSIKNLNFCQIEVPTIYPTHPPTGV